MRMRYHIQIILSICFFASCNKITTVPPGSDGRGINSADDCQALLDDDRVMNGYGDGGYPATAITGSDEYYLTDSQYNGCSVVDREVMIWSPRIRMGAVFPDWDFPYRTVGQANEAIRWLEGSSSHTPPAKRNLANARAHFYRAYAIYQLAQLFCPAYDSNSAATDHGLPLPQTEDVNEHLSRASVQETYDQIIGDLHISADIPSDDIDPWRTRPSLAAVYAMFARIYLNAGAYTLALRYADSCLQLQMELMSFKDIQDTGGLPFKRRNPEVIFCSGIYRSGPSRIGLASVDTILLRSYDDNDLRKKLFFTADGTFRGTYDESGWVFGGIATDEIWLIRSECRARTGDVVGAMEDLNHLLKTRWAAGTFIPFVATNRNDALRLILLERRKELLFRGTRWTDLRRLNKDTATAHDITRTIKGTIYTLPYNSERWVLPIPEYVLKFNPGMPDNDR
jgi:hypothetical protein